MPVFSTLFTIMQGWSVSPILCDGMGVPLVSDCQAIHEPPWININNNDIQSGANMYISTYTVNFKQFWSRKVFGHMVSSNTTFKSKLFIMSDFFIDGWKLLMCWIISNFNLQIKNHQYRVISNIFQNRAISRDTLPRHAPHKHTTSLYNPFTQTLASLDEGLLCTTQCFTHIRTTSHYTALWLSTSSCRWFWISQLTVWHVHSREWRWGDTPHGSQKHMDNALSIVSYCRVGEQWANITSPWVAVRRVGT